MQDNKPKPKQRSGNNPNRGKNSKKEGGSRSKGGSNSRNSNSRGGNQKSQSDNRRRGGSGPHQGDAKKSGSSNRRRRRPNNRRKQQQDSGPPPQPQLPPKNYGIVFFESHHQAHQSLDQLKDEASKVDQLNIVIAAEGPMDEPELIQFGKVYAGEAWNIIHKRRVEEGWYTEPH